MWSATFNSDKPVKTIQVYLMPHLSWIQSHSHYITQTHSYHLNINFILRFHFNTTKCSRHQQDCQRYMSIQLILEICLISFFFFSFLSRNASVKDGLWRAPKFRRTEACLCKLMKNSSCYTEYNHPVNTKAKESKKVHSLLNRSQVQKHLYWLYHWLRLSAQ